MNDKAVPVPTKEEVEQYFRLQNKVKAHARAVSEICTGICDCEEIENIIDDDDGSVTVGVWGSNYGHDSYEFPKEYLSMSLEAIKQRIEDKRREEQERRRLEREKAKAKREANKAKREAAKLEKERKEYERLKEKFDGKKKKSEKTPVYECAHFELDQDDPSGCGGSWSWCHNERSGTRECDCKYIYAQQFCPFYERGKLRGKWVISDNEMEAAKMFEKKRVLGRRNS